MIALEHRLREFLSVDPMFLAERQVDSDLAFVEIDIRERARGRDGGVESESEFSDHDLSFGFLDERIYLLEQGREVGGGKDPSSSYLDQERFCMDHFETVPRICFDERFPGDRFQIDRFREYLAYRESTALVLRVRIISRIPTSSLHRTIGEHVSLARHDSWSEPIRDMTMKYRFLSQVFRSPVDEGFLERFELSLLYVREMIEFDHMYSYIEELQTDTECREPEIGRLYEDDDRVLRKS